MFPWEVLLFISVQNADLARHLVSFKNILGKRSNVALFAVLPISQCLVVMLYKLCVVGLSQKLCYACEEDGKVAAD